MDKIKKILGLKADATAAMVEAAIMNALEQQKAASDALAKFDSFMKFQQRIFSELSLDVAKGDEAAYAKIKELVQSELDCRKYFEMALRKEATIRKVALMLFGKDEEPTEEVLLRAVQALLEQPSKGDTRALVQRISAEEAGEKAKELFHQYKDADVCFITSDGQGFFTEHHARNHNHTIKGGDYFKFER